MNMKKNKDDERKDKEPGLSKNLMKPGRNEIEQIANKLKDIKEQKSHFNEIASSLENLVTPVNSKNMTKNTSDTDSKASQVTKDGERPAKTNYVLDDERPSTSAAARLNNARIMMSTKDESMDELVYVDSEANVFVMQPDDNHEFYTENPPTSEEEPNLAMREIVIDDGELIILTGGNGEMVYYPEDTVAIDISDSRVFVVDARDNEVCLMEAAGDRENSDSNNIIEYLPEDSRVPEEEGCQALENEESSKPDERLEAPVEPQNPDENQELVGQPNSGETQEVEIDKLVQSPSHKIDVFST
ncbi:uncharacterized protein LOC108049752 [Drosophila rhopaloa]|uniref:Uncharacterized protein LOC108049752 n=1 Tax=Drosophila rhopaloa TaxID=1041015 RepID=A0A6P4FMQ6_DRORH|nr:uncharacterized protein LOC108049752 [Drosophila rhopaloa]